jgi:hypothetical protein
MSVAVIGPRASKAAVFDVPKRRIAWPRWMNPPVMAASGARRAVPAAKAERPLWISKATLCWSGYVVWVKPKSDLT